jgi:diguanylate cyclase (GGDEF)-like protein/PAS domain S-box-containing protein
VAHDEQPDGELLRLMSRVANAVPAMLAYWDAAQRCRFANQAYLKWFGVSPEVLLGKHIRDLLGPIYELNRPHIEAVLRGEPQQFDREIPDPAGGPPRFSQAHYVPDAIQGQVMGFFVLVVDITQRRALERALQEARDAAALKATHDYLTGLPNRMLLEDRLATAIEQARRRRAGCALLFIDVDRFKAVNDKLGHLAGDDVLRELARRMCSALRRADTVARLGGDEFVVLLPEAETRAQCEVVASQLLAVATSEPIAAGGQTVLVTLSIGIALSPKDAEGASALLRCADKALYAAKRAGRNTFAFYSEGAIASPRDAPPVAATKGKPT